MDVIIQAFLEIVFEVLIKGPGYLIVRAVRRCGKKPQESTEEPNPEGCLVLVVGVSFWCLIFFGLWTVFG